MQRALRLFNREFFRNQFTAALVGPAALPPAFWRAQRRTNFMKQHKYHLPDLIVEATWTRREVAAVFKISGKTIDRLVAIGQFPAPLHIGRSCRWRASDIQNYLQNGATICSETTASA